MLLHTAEIGHDDRLFVDNMTAFTIHWWLGLFTIYNKFICSCHCARKSLLLNNIMLPELPKSSRFRAIRLLFHVYSQLEWDIGGQMHAHSASVDGSESLLNTVFVFFLIFPSPLSSSSQPPLHLAASSSDSRVLYGWENNKRCTRGSVMDGWLTLCPYFRLPHLVQKCLAFRWHLFYCEDETNIVTKIMKDKRSVRTIEL